MSKIIFSNKLYVSNYIQSMIPQRGFGNKKVLSYELTLVSNCLCKEDLENFKALYKVQGISDVDSYSLDRLQRNLYELTNDIIIATPFCENINTFHLVYPKALSKNEYYSDWLYSHYVVSGKNIANPNFKNIIAKRNNSLNLNKEISKNSKLIAVYCTNEVWLDKNYIRKLVNTELEKFGKKLSSNTKILL